MEKYERLQALLEWIRDTHCRGNGAELARKLGKDPSYINRLFYPREKAGAKGIGLDVMEACTKVFQLERGFWEADPIELGPTPTRSALLRLVKQGPADVVIQEYDTGGKMGHGLVLQDQPGVIRKWVVSPDWVAKNVHRITGIANLAIVTGFGDSMRPLYNPGDPLLIDRGITRADIDGIYFFRVGDEGFVKRLQRIPTIDGVILRAKSDNEKYDPFDIVKGMDFEVFGRVVKAWRGEEF